MPDEDHHLTISPEIATFTFLQSHSPRINHRSAGEIATGTGSDRVPLIFAVNDKKGRHSGYLTLDKALDRFGLTMFPDAWGKAPCWHEMPFKTSADRSGYIMPRIGKPPLSKKGKVISIPLDTSDYDSTFLGHCAEMYWRACRGFRAVLIKKELLLYASDPQTTKKMKIRSRGILRDKHVDIFYTGTAPHRCDDGKVRRCRLYVGKRAFDRWISWPTYERLVPILRTTIDSVASTNGFSITKDIWNKTIAPIFNEYEIGYLGQFMKQNVFEKLPARKSRGRPNKVPKDVFQRHMAELTAMVSAEIAQFQSNLAAGHGGPSGEISDASLK
ncbi:hypothetical protein D3273_27225 [Lichenibacterium minor]|uniref:Uncharacterized protein n=1 Tax=Lichenibacterium minor TaxID=2316528 RepID=A0A4Q2U1Y0_9HYPH|nr:hypothetical protein [Lichenibacterium minor]RYC28831.1 hypothetical protein D3273_27225 [Lichenibacterium minor]